MAMVVKQTEGHAVRPDGAGGPRVDVHCHCLPGIDDGPATIAEAVELCRALVGDGFGEVIATPHQLGRFDGRNDAKSVRSAVAELQRVLDGENVPLRVHAGGDIRLDERLPRLLKEGVVCTLANGRYLLVELPHEIFLDPAPMFSQLLGEGYVPVVTHPERHKHLQRRPGVVKAWVEQGAVLQVTAASVVGEFGVQAQTASERWIGDGLVWLVATDAHNTTGRAPRMSAAISAIEAKHGLSVARALCIENPAGVIPRVGVSLPAVGIGVSGDTATIAQPDGSAGIDEQQPESPRNITRGDA